MKNIFGTVIATLGVAGIVLYALSSNSNSQMENTITRVLNDDAPLDMTVVKQFNDFTSKYHRSYLTKAEYQARLKAFRVNYETIQSHNDASFQLGLNQFADWTPEEYLQTLNNMTTGNDTSENTFLPKEEEEQNVTSLAAPQSVDWRKQGVVTSVKDQGKCAGCYAFASAAAMESAYKLKRGSLIEFSPQQLIDCTKGYRNAGCKGGFMTNCYKYLKDNSLQTLQNYPYVNSDTGACDHNNAEGKVKVASYVEIPKKNPQALLEAVAKQPVSVGIAAFCSSMMLYNGGVLTKSCGTVLNHAVVIVGYGTDSATGLDYWLVKNTWGVNWGEQGYVRMVRSMIQGDSGLNGITTLASYPIVD